MSSFCDGEVAPPGNGTERDARCVFAVDAEPRRRGAWTLVALSVPNGDAVLRRLLRARLRWLIVAPRFEATWLTPCDRVDQAQDLGAIARRYESPGRGTPASVTTPQRAGWLPCTS